VATYFASRSLPSKLYDEVTLITDLSSASANGGTPLANPAKCQVSSKNVLYVELLLVISHHRASHFLTVTPGKRRPSTNTKRAWLGFLVGAYLLISS
jgi:hypothetical protein